MSADNVHLVRRGFAAMLRGDLDAIAGVLHPDVRWHGGEADSEGACHNREQALTFMRLARSSGPLGELVDVIDAGDQVVLITRSRGPDGEPGALAANVATIRSGQVVEMVHYADPADGLAAAGVAPRTL